MVRSRVAAVAAAALIVLHLASGTSAAQARTTIISARVSYNTLKTRTNPQGELKEQIAEVDKQMADAIRLGKTGEVRRLIAKGTALLSGREWNERTDFAHSLVLRTDRQFVDSAQPLTIRLAQIYTPSLALAGSLVAKASLRKPVRPQAPIGPDGLRPAELVAELGTFDGVSRDLMDDPYLIDLPLAGYPNGPYVIQIDTSVGPASLPGDLLDKDRPLGTTRLDVELLAGLDERLRKLESGLRTLKGVDQAVPDVRYPADFLRKVNRGVVQRGTFVLGEELDRAEAVLASLVKGPPGKDPFDGRTGDFERHYVLAGAAEIMPYRVFVPVKYSRKRATPLVIALHGLGANEDSLFDQYDRRLIPLAESHGYLVAAPLGYRTDGFYGTGVATPPADAAERRKVELSEKDVMEVLARMKRQYNVDPARIYLMGHSMGAIGTWRLAAKYPEIWAALGPFAGTGDPRTIARMGTIPQFIVHGDADATVPVGGSRTMVAELKKLDVTHQYIEVPGGTHLDIVAPNLPAMFDFFDKQRKPSSTSDKSGR